MDMTNHTKRTVSLVKKFTEYLNFDKNKISEMLVGAALHDLGKAYLPKELLGLPRRLSDEEYSIVKRHPKLGYEILCEVTSSNIVLNMCLYHHERWDGTGYPCGLKGDNIPIEAQIMAMCDVYEALVSERKYKNAIEICDAIGIMRTKLGNHFNPEIGQKFIDFIMSEVNIDEC